MATRVAFLWSGIQGAYLGGWSENFWHPGTPVQALADAKRLKVKLMPCHSNQSKLTHIRCTPTDVTVAPVLFALAPPEIGTNIGREFGLNVMADAMLLEMRNSGTNEHTRQWIKGIPDGFVEQGRISVDGVIREQIRALTDALSAAPWSMYK